MKYKVGDKVRVMRCIPPTGGVTSHVHGNKCQGAIGKVTTVVKVYRDKVYPYVLENLSHSWKTDELESVGDTEPIKIKGILTILFAGLVAKVALNKAKKDERIGKTGN